MMWTLVRIVGILVAAAGVAAGWVGFEAVEEIRRLENDIATQEGQVGRRISKATADKRIAECRREIEEKTAKRNLWFGVGGGTLLLGLVMLLLPSGSKRKAPLVEPMPAAGEEAAGPT